MRNGRTNEYATHSVVPIPDTTVSSYVYLYRIINDDNIYAMKADGTYYRFGTGMQNVGPAGPTGGNGSAGPTGSNGNDGSDGVTTGGLIGYLPNFNMNSTSDQIIGLTGGYTFVITDVIITNASTSLTTAADFEIWSGPSRSGDLIVVSNAGINDALLSLTASNSYVSRDGNSNDVLSINQSNKTVGSLMYASLSTPQGSSATVDIYVYGHILSPINFVVGPSIQTFDPMIGTYNITTNARITWVNFSGLITTDINISQTDKTNSHIGDTIYFAAKFDTSAHNLDFSSSDFFIWQCGDSQSEVSVRANQERLVMIFTYDGDKWCNTYDNC